MRGRDVTRRHVNDRRHSAGGADKSIYSHTADSTHPYNLRNSVRRGGERL